MDRDEVEVHKHAKKEQGQYPAILAEQVWSIKRDKTSKNDKFSLPARGASHIIINGIITKVKTHFD